jgi:hypothetical protein
MYKFGIGYYEYIETVRTPITGLTVKLVVPGQNWASGVVLSEISASGYYVNAALENPGLYEIWDDNDSEGAASGKTVQIGKVQTADIEDDAIDANKLANESVNENNIGDSQATHAKLANNAVEANNIKDGEVPIEKLGTSLQSQIGQFGDDISSLEQLMADMTTIPIFFGYLDSPPVIAIPACPISGRSYMAGDTYVIIEAGIYMSNLCAVGDHLVYDGASWTCIESKIVPLQTKYYTKGLFYWPGIVEDTGYIPTLYNLVDFTNNATQASRPLQPSFADNFGHTPYAAFDSDKMMMNGLKQYIKIGVSFTIILKCTGSGNIMIAKDAANTLYISLEDNDLTISTKFYTYTYPIALKDDDIIRISFDGSYFHIQINSETEDVDSSLAIGMPNSTSLQIGDDDEDPFTGNIKYVQIINRVLVVDDELAKFINQNTA